MNTWVEYDVTPFVTGNGTYSFSLATTSNDGIDFYNRENATLRPELVVTLRCHAPPVEQAQEGDRGGRRHDRCGLDRARARRRRLRVAARVRPEGRDARRPLIHLLGRRCQRPADAGDQPSGRRRARAVLVGRRARSRSARWTATSATSTLERGRSRRVGSPEAPIEANVAHLFQPSWAPDGKQGRDSRARARHLHRRHATAASKRLTTGTSDEAPDWAAVGDWIAFHRRDRGNQLRHLCGQRRHRRGAEAHERRQQQTNATWFPTGKRVAFAEQRPNGKWAIVTMRTDGTGRRMITDAATSAQEPSWSPNGTEHRLHPPGAGQGRRRGHSRQRERAARPAPDRRQHLSRETDLVAGRQEHRVCRRGGCGSTPYELRQ